MQRSGLKCDDWRFAERRKEARFTMILRVGVLEQNGKSSLCLVKNISTSGVKLKCYARPVVDAEASIRVADEPPLRGRLVWIDNDIVGMSFAEELDAAALLRVQQKLRPNRRRTTPRVDVAASACLRTGGRIYHAAVCDISSVGARIKTITSLKPGDRAIVTLSGLPSLESYVRWSDGNEAGLAFETPIPMQILANWIDGRISLTG
jgi:PilZ domain-containing protein